MVARLRGSVTWPARRDRGGCYLPAMSSGSAVFLEKTGLDAAQVFAVLGKTLALEVLDDEPQVELFERKREGISAVVVLHEEEGDGFDLLKKFASHLAAELGRPTWMIDTFSNADIGTAAMAFDQRGKRRWTMDFSRDVEPSVLSSVRAKLGAPRLTPSSDELPFWRMVSEWKSKPKRDLFGMGDSQVLDLAHQKWKLVHRGVPVASGRRRRVVSPVATRAAPIEREVPALRLEPSVISEERWAAVEAANQARAALLLDDAAAWKRRLRAREIAPGPSKIVQVPRALLEPARQLSTRLQVPLEWVLQQAIWFARTWSLHWTHFKAIAPVDLEAVELRLAPGLEAALKSVRRPDLKDASFDEMVCLRLLVGVPRLALELGAR